MATAAQKAKVGVFVFLCALLIAGGLAAFLWPGEQGHRYTLIFDDPIEGLQYGSKVTYLGVPVGEVTSIDVTKNKKAQVRIRVRPNRVRLSKGVHAELVIRSFAAGTRAVSLRPGDPGAPDLEPGSRIPTRPSALNSIRDDIAGIAKRLNRFLAGMEQQKLASLFSEARKAIEDARKLLGKGDALVTETTRAAKAIRKRVVPVAQRIDKVARDAERLIESTRGKVEKIDAERLQKRIETAVATLERTAERFSRLARSFVERVDRLERATRDWFGDTRPLLRAARRFIEQLRANPAALIRGKPAKGEEAK